VQQLSASEASSRDAVRVLPISIRTAAGRGRTMMSAFDDALLGAGVANFNLIRLSSVIPQPSVISFNTEPLRGDHGDRLYCVYAAAHAERHGETAWAGIGWVRDASGRGLFVEHSADSEQALLDLIQLSLEDMSERRGGGYADLRHATVSAHNEEQPACALALASYEVAGWELT